MNFSDFPLPILAPGVNPPKKKTPPKPAPATPDKSVDTYLKSSQSQIDQANGVDLSTGYKAFSGQDLPGSGGNTLTSSQANALNGIQDQLSRIPVRVGNPTVVTKKDRYGDIVPGVGYQPPLTTLGAAINDFHNMDPNSLAALQRELIAGGLLKDVGKGHVVLGTFDAATEAAYEKLLTEAARKQVSTGALLNQYKNGEVAPPVVAGANDQAPLQLQLTNPDDIRQAALAAGQKLLGRDPDEGFITNFITAYHSAEATSQQQAYNGDTSIQAPNLGSEAESKLKSERGTQVNANTTEQGIETLRTLVKG